MGKVQLGAQALGQPISSAVKPKQAQSRPSAHPLHTKVGITSYLRVGRKYAKEKCNGTP